MTPVIIYEDSEIIVFDKPAGMIVNRAASVKGETVQEWVEDNLKFKISNLKFEEQSDFFRRSGIVHRLDKDTSGLLLVAKTPEAFAELQRQFKERTVHKKYLALVHGEVTPSEGEITAPVGRLPWDREKFGVFAGGREAKTAFSTIAFRNENGFWVVSQGWEVWMRKNFPLLTLKTRPTTHNSPLQVVTLLSLSPTTGRTHQIRVHLKYLGHPIVGDPLYAGRKNLKEDKKITSRMFLHAAEISFIHPKSGGRVTFTNDLPDELKKVLLTA